MASNLTDSDYHRLAAAVLDHIESLVDRWLDENRVDIDARRTGGLLELTFPNGSKVIVNTQPPLHEIWLAALRGGFHYRYLNGEWVDTKDSSRFVDTLSACATEQAGLPLTFW